MEYKISFPVDDRGMIQLDEWTFISQDAFLRAITPESFNDLAILDPRFHEYKDHDIVFVTPERPKDANGLEAWAAMKEIFKTKAELEDAVAAELKRQFTKWGIQNNSVDQWNSYLLEEYGEAVKEMNNVNFEPDLDKQLEMWDNAIKEATEMIAVAVNWVHEMKRRRDETGLTREANNI